jgi:hypothetical protein
VATNVPEFPSVWLNEVQPKNVNTLADRFGQYSPWVELYNPSTNQVDLTGLYLANNYNTNQLQWAFPTGTVMNAGEFKVIWLDGADSNSIPEELHANFTIPENAGAVALYRVYPESTAQLVDYLNYTNVGNNLSYGAYPDGQPFYRALLGSPTPGSTNLPWHEITMGIGLTNQDTIVLRLNAQAGVHYRIEYQANFDPTGAWFSLPGYEEIVATEELLTVSMPLTSEPGRFFRVRKLP